MSTTAIHSEAQTAAPDEVEMQIRGLMMDPVTNMPIIVLKDVASDLVLPIWVGIFEANAIALELEKTAPPRPMTHDLLQNMARGLNATVRKVVVSELRDDTFFAVIWMDLVHELVMREAQWLCETQNFDMFRGPLHRVRRGIPVIRVHPAYLHGQP